MNKNNAGGFQWGFPATSIRRRIETCFEKGFVWSVHGVFQPHPLEEGLKHGPDSATTVQYLGFPATSIRRRIETELNTHLQNALLLFSSHIH